MKNYHFLLLDLLLVSVFLVYLSAAPASSPASIYDDVYTAQEPVSDSMHVVIYEAAVDCFMKGKVDPLSELEPNVDVLYWQAYLQYWKAIFFVKMGNNDESQAAIQSGIDMLESMPTNSAEYLALQGMLLNFSINFETGMRAGVLAAKVKKVCKKAIKLDPQSTRAYYVLGVSDFYTPEKWGGGEECEDYFKKAIETPENLDLGWGKINAYQMLLQHYINLSRTEDALALYEEAKAIYPEDYRLQELASNLNTDD
ncbi:MAG: hypothetical protein AAF135_07280 [Bacteroidota bacterium]